MITYVAGSAQVFEFGVVQQHGIADSKTNFPRDDKVCCNSDSATNKASAVDAGCAFLLVPAPNVFLTSIQARIKNDSHQELRNIFFPF